MTSRLAFALDAANRAGRFTLAHFQSGVGVDLKEDSTPVTIADKGAEHLIREMIAESFPGEHILGEEEGGDPSVPDRWIIDPIDGTKSFISGVPLYSTLLSYEIDFQPVLGVAFFPGLDETFFAETGEGAFLNGRPIQVGERKSIDGSVICCGGHKSMIKNGRWDGFASIVGRAMATRTWSDAYGHALVACGRVDAMVDPEVSRWDISSIQVIIREAGGKFTDFKGGQPLSQDLRLEAISSNPWIQEELLEVYAR